MRSFQPQSCLPREGLNIAATMIRLELLGNALRDPPILEQDAPALGIALFQGLGLFDPVGAEVAVLKKAS